MHVTSLLSAFIRTARPSKRHGLARHLHWFNFTGNMMVILALTTALKLSTPHDLLDVRPHAKQSGQVTPKPAAPLRGLPP